MNVAQRNHTITEITRLNNSKERLGKNLKFLGLSMLLDINLMAVCGIVEIKFRGGNLYPKVDSQTQAMINLLRIIEFNIIFRSGNSFLDLKKHQLKKQT